MAYLRQSFELFIWLWIQPSKWRAHLHRIDTEIPSNFGLVDLKWSQLKNPDLRSVMLAAYVFIPCGLLIICLPVVALLTGEIAGSLIGVLFVYILGLCIGIYISFPASVLFIVIASVIVQVQWAGSSTITYDFIYGTRASVLFGLSTACMVIAAVSHGDEAQKQTVLRQIGAIVLGLLVSIPIVAGVVYIVFTTTAGRQAGSLHGSMMIWTMVIPPLVLSVVIVYLRTKRLLKTILPAFFCMYVVSLGYGDLGYEYDRSAGGFDLLSANLTISISTFCMLVFFSYVLVQPFVGDLPASITGAVSGLAIHFGVQASNTYYPLVLNVAISVVFILLAIFFRHAWSVLAYPLQAAWNRMVVELDIRRDGAHRNLQFHSASWDEIQQLPFFELEEYLIASAEKNTDEGKNYIDRINRSHQQWAAQSVLTELDARRLESLPDINHLANASTDESAGLLPGSAGLILRGFSQLSQDISAGLAQPNSFNQVLVFRTVIHDLEKLQLELNRNYKDKVATRFAAVAEHWRGMVVEHTDLLDERSRANKEIPNPYTVGVPLTRRQNIFVGRTDTARFLEDILKIQDHPPLLLYGPRRMGKTSLLYQLHWMLPRHILTLIVDLQGPVGLAQDHSGFIFALARAMSRAAERANIKLSVLSRHTLNEDPFVKFDEWLNTVEAEMLDQSCDTMLLALDEFEALDTALRQGVLKDYAVLGMLRHIVQHRTRIKIMLVGSHALGEFKRWSSYFVNAQVIELSYLSATEARQLIEQPIADFPLKYRPEATTRLVELTRGHPYLIQLAGSELIALKNSQSGARKQIVALSDIELCIPLTLERGQQFFTDIELNQVDDDGREYLLNLANAQVDAIVLPTNSHVAMPNTQVTSSQLQQRSLIESVGNRYQFQIELVRHWFQKDNPHR